MTAGIGDLLGVLAAAFLLGVEVWVVTLLLLAWLVARPVAIGAAAMVRVVAAFALSAVVYVVVVVALALPLVPR